MPLLFKSFGIIGLLLITWSIFVKPESKRDGFAAVGGVFLLAYSIYLRDAIFIILQIIFIIVNLYEINKIKTAARHLPLPISNEETIKLATGKTDEA